MDSEVWILVISFSENSLILVGLVSVITDNPIMYWMWALGTSLGFAYLVMRMLLARVYPSLLKGNPSITALTLGKSSSFKYESLATWPMSDLSIVASNCPQNLCQSTCRCVLWNFVLTSLGSLTFSLAALLAFSMVLAWNFFLIWSFAFFSFSCVSQASCFLNFCFSCWNSSITFSYLANSAWILKL